MKLERIISSQLHSKLSLQLSRFRARGEELLYPGKVVSRYSAPIRILQILSTNRAAFHSSQRKGNTVETIAFSSGPEIPGCCREIDSSRDTRKARRDRFQPRKKKKKRVCKQLQPMMRSLQRSPETLPADPWRIIHRPPSVKFIEKEKRKRP